jgi:hypothetical protein
VPELTDEHIESLFADLRADEIRQVRPPGIAAARTTVRHRRTVQSVAAGVAVLAVVGGVSAVSLNVRGPSSGIAGSTTDAEPVQPGEAAKHTVDEKYPGEAVDAHSGPIPTVVRNAGRTLPGNYVLAVTCVGTGTMHVLVETATPDARGRLGRATSSSTSTVQCSGGAGGAAQIWDEHLRSDGAYTVTLTASGGTPGLNGFAWKLLDESADDDRFRMPAYSEAERNALAGRAKKSVEAATPGGAVQLSAGLSLGMEDTLTSAEAPYGAQLIRIACVGDGRINVVVRNQSDAGPDDTSAGKELAIRNVACSDEPTVTAIPFSYTKGTLAVVIDPNREALGRSGIAYSLTSS